MASRSLHLPILIDIPEPCSEAWDNMVGGDRERHCARCDKQIHNLSVLTQDQIAELVLRENVCVSLEARADGTLLNADPPVREYERKRGHASRVVMAAALTALAACGPDHVVGKMRPSHPANAATAEPSVRTAGEPALAVPAASCDAPAAASAPAIASGSAAPPAPTQRLTGTPGPADPPPAPVTRKVGKMMRVPAKPSN